MIHPYQPREPVSIGPMLSLFWFVVLAICLSIEARRRAREEE